MATRNEVKGDIARHRPGRCGRAEDRVGGPADAGAGRHPRAVRRRASAGRLADQRLPARHRRDGEPDAHARRPAEPTRSSARRTRSRPRTTWPPRWWRITASRPSPSRARTATPTTGTSARRSTTGPQVTMDDGADLVNELHTRRTELLDGGRRRDRGDDHRRHPAARHGQGRQARATRCVGGQRGAHQAPLRQPLRDRAERDRRHPARHEHPVRRQDGRGRRLRLGRSRDRLARARDGRATWSWSRSTRSARSRRRWTATA